MSRPSRGSFSAWLRGGQTIGHTIDMAMEVLKRLVIFALLWGGVCVFLLNSQTTGHQQTLGILGAEARLLDWFGAPLPQVMAVTDPAGVRHNHPVSEIPHLPWLKAEADVYYRKGLGYFILWLLGDVLLIFGTALWYTRFGRDKTKSRQIRGQEVATVSELIRQVEEYNDEQREAKKRPHFRAPRLLNVPYPYGTETQHTLISAAPGAGKTVALHSLIDSVRLRNDRAIIFDPDLAFISHHYNPETDVILNCFDERSAHWTPFADAREIHEWAKLAESLFKDGNTNDSYWTNATRQVFSWAGYRLATQPEGCTVATLLEVCGNEKTLRKILEGTPAAQHLAEGSPNRLGALLSVLAEGITPLVYLVGGKEAFSIRKWVNHPEVRPGFLFLSAPETHMAVLRPLLSFQCDLVVASLLNRRAEGVASHPTWVILEEFPALGEMESLANAPQRLRQYGGAMVICLQQLSQLEDIYGREKARTIVGQCATRLFLKANDTETAKFVSEQLGRRQMHRVIENTSFGANSIRDGAGLAPREEMEPNWLPEDVMNWPALQGVITVSNVRQSGPFPMAPLKFTPKDREQVADGWIPLKGVDPVRAFLDRNKAPEQSQAPETGGPAIADQQGTAGDSAAVTAEKTADPGDTPSERDRAINQRKLLDAEHQREQDKILREQGDLFAARKSGDPGPASDVGRAADAALDAGLATPDDLGLENWGH